MDNTEMELKDRWGDMVCTDVPEGRNLWRALVNMVMNLWVHSKGF
jgi:hypothetical protein